MVFFNIAYSLEFIVIGLGAVLLSWSWYKESCKNYYCRDERVTAAPDLEASKNPPFKRTHRHCGTGLGKALGSILIILGIANFGATIYDNVNFKRHLAANMNNTNTQQKWRILGQNTAPSGNVGDNAISTPAAPGSENSVNSENSNTGNYAPSDNSANTNNQGSLPTTPSNTPEGSSSYPGGPTQNNQGVPNPNNTQNGNPGAPGTPVGSQNVGQPTYPQTPNQANP